ncbi:MAG: HAD family hydrolase [Rhodoferax sp.]|jgi:putative hydrolase of the HAD superfamily|nr:HAD family hydrolase [Rhodoferax sp.]
MSIKGIIFDINGTLIDIHTNEWHDEVYRVVSNLLSYQGVNLNPEVVKDLFFRTVQQQKQASRERQPEFDAVAVFRDIVAQHASAFTRTLSHEQRAQLPKFLAEAHRAASRMRLQLYPGVQETIRQLHARYALAIVSDAQTVYALAELNTVGLSGFFDPIIVSGDFGYRKPDPRLFEAALRGMKLEPAEVLFVGNDLYRDIHGPQQLGIKTVFFKSSDMQQEREDATPDYIIYNFPELLNAVRYFEAER